MDTRPLRIVPYRRLWSSSVVTQFGSQLTIVAVPKQLYDITGSSAYVGLSGLVALVPLAVFGLWGGVVADVVDRRRLLLATNSGIALTSALLCVQAATGARSVGLILALLGLQQACFGMNQTTRGAVIVRLVPPADLPAANALNTTMVQLGAVIGPLMAGALLPFVGLAPLYLLDSVGLTVMLYAVWRLPPLPPTAGAPTRAGLRNLLEGFRYISARSVLLLSFLADLIAMIVGMPRALFPEMALHTFGDPAGGGLALGILYAAIPIGAVTGTLFSGLFTRVRRYGVMVVLAIVAWGLAMTGFGLTNALWIAAIFLGLGGVADVVSAIFRRAILQTGASDEMQGRSQGVFTVVVAGGPRMADLVHGTVGAALGTRLTVTAGGLLVVVLMVAVTALAPAFWRYRGPGPEDTELAAAADTP
ncbi:MAG: MFS transporter [Candidatus Dormibacteraeota bacterium]|nr:MFS transporter [Candidatus Dormibacteraeota bacterium]